MDCFHKGFVFVLTCLMFVSSASAQDQAGTAPPSNEAILQHMQQLEQELKDLRAEVTALKSGATAASAPAASAPATSAPAPAAAPPTQAVVAATSSAPAAPAPTGLAGLLGPVTLSGFVDAYYGYNSNHPYNLQNNLRNFDVNTNQFGLNMIELVADKSVDTTNRLGYHIALGFGQAMAIVNTGSTTGLGVDQYLKEGYLEYMAPVGKGLQVNVGKFVTPAGAEVIESKDDWNYSRSLLFSFGIPYFHFGANAKYAFSPKFAVTTYLVNGWNGASNGKTGGFSAAWTPNAKFSITETYLVGPTLANINIDNSDIRQLTDTVITYNPNAKLSFMANYDFGRQPLDPAEQKFLGAPYALAKWSGLAGYAKYAPNDKWAVALRGEYFNDNQGFMTDPNAFNPAIPVGKTQELSEFTATVQRTISSRLIARLEGRRDMSDLPSFQRGGLPTGESGVPNFVSGQNTITLGLIYAFSSADAK